MISNRAGLCVLCRGEVNPGDEIKHYLSSWSHACCVARDCSSRTDHTPGFTYFLELESREVKIGFTSREDTFKMRIKKAHQFIAPVRRVLGVQDGGESLEAYYHLIFSGLASGGTECFFMTDELLSAAELGHEHWLVDIGNEFLAKNRNKW